MVVMKLIKIILVCPLHILSLLMPRRYQQRTHIMIMPRIGIEQVLKSSGLNLVGAIIVRFSPIPKLLAY
jgi:hypothetical protein